jgi:hypothetical protein
MTAAHLVKSLLLLQEGSLRCLQRRQAGRLALLRWWSSGCWLLLLLLLQLLLW